LPAAGGGGRRGGRPAVGAPRGGPAGGRHAARVQGHEVGGLRDVDIYSALQPLRAAAEAAKSCRRRHSSLRMNAKLIEESQLLLLLLFSSKFGRAPHLASM